jgi:hypothetical protein
MESIVAFELHIELYKGLTFGVRPERQRRPACRYVGTLTQRVYATRLPAVGERICNLGPWPDTRPNTTIPTAGLEVVTVIHPSFANTDEAELPVVAVVAPWDDDDDLGRYVETSKQRGWSWLYVDEHVGSKLSDSDHPDSVPSDAMRLAEDELFEYDAKGLWDSPALCHLRIYRDPADTSPPVVIVGELDDGWPGRSLTNNAEVIIAAVSEAYFNGKGDFRLILYYPSDTSWPRFQEVIFSDQNFNTERDVAIKWGVVDNIRDAVKGALVADWYPGDYTARAVAGLSGDERNKVNYAHNEQRKPRLYRKPQPPPSTLRKLLSRIK